MHTRYSPVRRSPTEVLPLLAAPRLACVKPVASVHPELRDQTLRCLSCSFCFSLSFRQPDQQPRIVPASALFFSSLTGGLPPSSFVLSLYRIISMFSALFPFRKAVTKVLPLFLTAKFFANFFSSFFSRTPRPRRSDALRHHAKASRPPVCFAFAVAKVLPFTFPAKLFSIFFAPFFNFFHNTLILRHLFRKLFSPRFPSFATETSPNYLHTLLYI